MTCEDVRQELVAHLAAELGEALRGAIDDHLSGCRPCRDECARLEATGALLDAFLSSPGVAVGPGEAVLDSVAEASPAALAARVPESLAAGGATRRGGRSAAVPARRSARGGGRPREVGPGSAVAFGAAAVVLLSIFIALSQTRRDEAMLLASRWSGTSGASAVSARSASERGEVRERPADPAEAGLTRSDPGGFAVVGDRSDVAVAPVVGRAGPGSRGESDIVRPGSRGESDIVRPGSDAAVGAPGPGSDASVGAPGSGSDASGGTPGSGSDGAGAVPDELRENPDMFLDFVIVRRLEKLRRLPELLADTRAGGEEAG